MGSNPAGYIHAQHQQKETDELHRLHSISSETHQFRATGSALTVTCHKYGYSGTTFTYVFGFSLTVQQCELTGKTVRPTLFICDLQEKFRSAIYEFPKVVTTTQKLLKASQILNIPVFATTQLRAKLGETCPELGLDSAEGVKTKAHADKSRFSMWTPEIQHAFQELGSEKRVCVIVGIEAHICVTQTTLDLLREGHEVYVMADGVSSCNPEEIPIALRRLQAAGATVTSSESFLYECMGDAGIAEFKAISGLVREYNAKTKSSLQALCRF